MRFAKIYLEVTNICNLDCSFCPKTKRARKELSISEFEYILPKIKPYTNFLYFHLMGEPLNHSKISTLLQIAEKFEFKVIITTNGTLINQYQDILLNSKALHKINISLHAFEANNLKISFEKYLDNCFKFGKENNGNKLVVYRLWNKGGNDKLNQKIIEILKQYFDKEWTKNSTGYKLQEKTFLEYGKKFDWPDINIKEINQEIYCYGLKDQIGILSNGDIVPCCLDHEGDIKLGNIFESDLKTILNSNLALEIYNGFKNKKAIHPLCKRCGYARRFTK